MSSDENTRIRIRQYFVELMDEELADAIMESMPPVPWTELATKDDIARLENRFDVLEHGLSGRFDSIDRRFESIDRRFESIDRRFESIDRRFDEVDERWNGRFDEMIQRLNERYDLLSSSFHNEMVGLEGRLAMRFMETTRLIVFSALFMMVAVVGTIITVAGVN